MFDNFLGLPQTFSRFRANLTGGSILSRSNDPVPVETRLQLVLAVLAQEMTVAEAARRYGVSAE